MPQTPTTRTPLSKPVTQPARPTWTINDFDFEPLAPPPSAVPSFSLDDFDYEPLVPLPLSEARGSAYAGLVPEPIASGQVQAPTMSALSRPSDPAPMASAPSPAPWAETPDPAASLPPDPMSGWAGVQASGQALATRTPKTTPTAPSAPFNPPRFMGVARGTAEVGIATQPQDVQGPMGLADFAAGLVKRDASGAPVTRTVVTPQGEEQELPLPSKGGMAVTPFVGPVAAAIDAYQVIQAAKRVRDGEATDADTQTLADYQRQELEQARRGTTLLYDIASVASQIPAFATEFAATGGGFSATKKLVQEAVEKALGTMAQKTAGRAAATVAGYTAGAAAQEALMPQRVAAEALRRQQPTAEELQTGPQGLAAWDDAFLPALAKAIPDQFVEVFSERTGGAVEGVVGRLAKLPLAQRATAMKEAVLQRWLKLHPDQGARDFFNQVATEAGWNGVLGEIFEERVGEVMRAAQPYLREPGQPQPAMLRMVTGEPTADTQPGENPRAQAARELGRQLVVEAAAFAIPGAGAALATRASGALRRDGTPPPASTPPPAPAEPVAALPTPTPQPTPEPAHDKAAIRAEMKRRMQEKGILPAETAPAEPPTPAVDIRRPGRIPQGSLADLARPTVEAEAAPTVETPAPTIATPEPAQPVVEAPAAKTDATDQAFYDRLPAIGVEEAATLPERQWQKWVNFTDREGSTPEALQQQAKVIEAEKLRNQPTAESPAPPSDPAAEKAAIKARLRQMQQDAGQIPAEKAKADPVQDSQRERTLTDLEDAGIEPWQVTRGAWVSAQRAERRKLGQSEESGPRAAPFSDYENYHKDAVTRAQNAGKPVPASVLADYPDIAPNDKVAISTIAVNLREGTVDRLPTTHVDRAPEDKAAEPPRYAPPTTTQTAAGVSVSLGARGSVEVKFAKKPDQSVLDSLKRNGFKRVKTDKSWFHPLPGNLTSERGSPGAVVQAAMERTRELVGLGASDAASQETANAIRTDQPGPVRDAIRPDVDERAGAGVPGRDVEETGTEAVEAAEPEAGAWLDTLEPNQREAVFAAMRDIRTQAEVHNKAAQKLTPPTGQIPVGAAAFDEVIGRESREAFLRALNKGMTPQAAAEAAKADVKVAVQRHNAKRKDIGWQRWEGSADATIDDQMRRVLRATSVTTPSEPTANLGPLVAQKERALRDSAGAPTKAQEDSIDRILAAEQVLRPGVPKSGDKASIERAYSTLKTHAGRLGIPVPGVGTFFSKEKYRAAFDAVTIEIAKRYGSHPTADTRAKRDAVIASDTERAEARKAKVEKRTTARDYLSESVQYGGETMSRGERRRRLIAGGSTAQEADAYESGAALAAERQDARARGESTGDAETLSVVEADALDGSIYTLADYIADAPRFKIDEAEGALLALGDTDTRIWRRFLADATPAQVDGLARMMDDAVEAIVERPKDPPFDQDIRPAVSTLAERLRRYFVEQEGQTDLFTDAGVEPAAPPAYPKERQPLKLPDPPEAPLADSATVAAWDAYDDRLTSYANALESLRVDVEDRPYVTDAFKDSLEAAVEANQAEARHVERRRQAAVTRQASPERQERAERLMRVEPRTLDSLAAELDIHPDSASVLVERLRDAGRVTFDGDKWKTVGATVKATDKPEPAQGDDTADEIRRRMGLSLEKIDAYDAEQAVSKVGTRWTYRTLEGNDHPSLFDTRKAAVEAASRHIDLKREQYENPEGFWDVTSLRATSKLERMEELEAGGLSEMEASKAADLETAPTASASLPPIPDLPALPTEINAKTTVEDAEAADAEYERLNGLYEQAKARRDKVKRDSPKRDELAEQAEKAQFAATWAKDAARLTRRNVYDGKLMRIVDDEAQPLPQRWAAFAAVLDQLPEWGSKFREFGRTPYDHLKAEADRQLEKFIPDANTRSSVSAQVALDAVTYPLVKDHDFSYLWHRAVLQQNERQAEDAALEKLKALEQTYGSQNSRDESRVREGVRQGRTDAVLKEIEDGKKADRKKTDEADRARHEASEKDYQTRMVPYLAKVDDWARKGTLQWRHSEFGAYGARVEKWIPYSGKPVTIPTAPKGWSLFIADLGKGSERGRWSIIEATTGMSAGAGKTQAEVIAAVTERFEKLEKPPDLKAIAKQHGPKPKSLTAWKASVGASDAQVGGSGGGSEANIGYFTEDIPVTTGTLATRAIEFPEMVALATELQATPTVVRAFRKPGKAGEFSPNGIRLTAELFTKGNERQLAAVLAHEIGHLVDWLPTFTLKRGNLLGRLRSLRNFLKGTFTAPDGTVIKNPEIRAELLALSNLWRPWDPAKATPSFAAYRKSGKELYADAISVLLNNPGLLETKAPIFYREFFKALDQKPDVAADYFALLSTLAGTREDLVRRSRERVRFGMASGEAKALDLQQQALASREAERKNLGLHLRRLFADKNAPVNDLVNAARARGVVVPEDEDPRYLLEARNYIGGKQKGFLERRVVPVFDALVDAGIEWADFGEYLFNDRILTGDRSEMANPYGIQPDRAEEHQAQLLADLGPEKADVLEREVRRFREAARTIAQEAYDAGLYTDELYAQMQENPAYAPFRVVEYMDTHVNWQVIKQIGTLKAVGNPADAFVLKMLATIRAIERQTVTTGVVDWLQTHEPTEIEDAKTRWTGKTHEPVDPRDGTQGLLTYYVRGRRVGKYVDKVIADSVMNESIGRNGALMTILNWVSGAPIFRPIFTTFNLGWQGKNFIRDFTRFWANAPGMTLRKALRLYARAVPAARLRAFGPKDNERLVTDRPRSSRERAQEALLQAEESEILSVTYNDLGRSSELGESELENTIAKHGVQGVSKPPTYAMGVQQVVEVARFVQALGDFIETLPKMAAIDYFSDGQGAKELTPAQRSFIRKMIGTPDLLAGGTLTPATNKLAIYSNAAIQGNRSDWHLILHPEDVPVVGVGASARAPRASAVRWKLAGAVLLPKLLMRLMLMGLFGAALREIMRKGSTKYDRRNNLVVPLGTDDQGNGIIAKIPPSEVGKMIGGLFDIALDAVLPVGKRDIPGALTNLVDYSGGQLPSISPLPQIVGNVGQKLAGGRVYDAFRGRFVLSEDEAAAGGPRAWQKYISWQLQQAGAGSVWKWYVGQDRPEEKTTAQRIMDLPIGSLAQNFIRITSYGETESLRDVQQSVRSDEAERRLSTTEAVNTALRAYQKLPPPQQTKATQRRMAREIVAGIEGLPKADRAERERAIEKRLRMGVVRGKADPLVDAVLSATSNAQKVAILTEAAKEQPAGEFSTWLVKAKIEEVISDEVYTQTRKALRQAPPSAKVAAVATGVRR
jgi:hypothetical protein